MSTNDAIKDAREAISKILKILRISTVVYIDDVFEVPGLEELMRLLRALAESQQERFNSLIPFIDLADPNEVWTARLRDELSTWLPDRRKQLLNQIAEIEDATTTPGEDARVASRVGEFFSGIATYRELSPSGWESTASTFFSAIDSNSRLLCLFDQDLHHSPGYHTSSGILLLQNALATGRSENLFCGLITHTITSLDAEIPMWRGLSKEHDLRLEEFLPLAKIRLSDDTSPMVFADGIKKTVMNLICERMKDSAVRIFKVAHDESIVKLADLDVYDFDHIVLQSSHKEGAWEADTLLRIFNIFQQDVVRRLILDPKSASPFNELVERARPISAVSMPQIPTGSPGNVRKVRRTELYEAGETIRHTPLMLGDVFTTQMQGTAQNWVLLAQPCDLMVRSDGTRGQSSLLVPLAKIVERLPYKKAKEKPQSYWSGKGYLEYFFEASADFAIVDFKTVLPILIDVLDLSVLDTEGICRLDCRDPSPIPPQLALGWRVLLERIVSDLQNRAKELDTLLPEVKKIPEGGCQQKVIKALLPSICVSESLRETISYVNSTFNFGVQRGLRFRDPGATRLLRSFAAFAARDAEPHDFAGTIRDLPPVDKLKR